MKNRFQIIMKNLLLIVTSFIIIISLNSCNNDDSEPAFCLTNEPEYEFISDDGSLIRIFENAEIYLINNNDCSYLGQYYDLNFFDQVYNRTDSGTFINLGENNYFKPFNEIELDFDTEESILDLIILDESQTDRIFTNFTMQSPSAKTVNEYVALQNCILDETCDFIDNSLGLIPNPDDNSDQIMEFYAVSPSSDMVTSKASISSSLLFFEKGDNFWFEAKYYIDGDIPTTIADFESTYFLENPGPRLIFKQNHLAVENKFGDKITYRQPTGQEVDFPTDQWVTVKVHLRYHESDGIIQVWQDDNLIIDQTGRTIPVSNWIQNKLEIGITATDDETTLYLNDLRFSNEAF